MSLILIGDGSKRQHSAGSIGAKAANLARMAALDLPVPPAFVLPVRLCAAVIRGDRHAGRELRDDLKRGIAFLESRTGKRFGDRRQPLLVSVRSGAERSMPGMLDTVLDVGCTLDAVQGLIRSTGRLRLAWDCRRRFLESYAETVLGLPAASFAARRDAAVAAESATTERDLDSAAIEELAAGHQAAIEEAGEPCPDDPMAQLEAAARAVYRSWTSERAITYRRLQHLESLQGTAVTVQTMVFGNSGPNSGAGVAFSRDPSTGAPQPVIDMVLDGQGEDVVSGRRPPDDGDTIARALPDLATELTGVLTRLERAFGDVQDVEFTVEDGRLWLLQTRDAKRTPRAALRFVVDLVREGVMTPQAALRRLEGIDLGAIAETHLIDAGEPAARGIAASAGIATGRAAFSLDDARQIAGTGDPVILLRPDATTGDIAGFAIAAGIVTATGARTSHAALVARQLGKPCIVGCTRLRLERANSAMLGDTRLGQGDWLTIDGGNGEIFPGRLDVATVRPEAELAEVERWRDDRSAGHMAAT